MFDNGALRKGLLLIGLAAVWELYARWLANPLLFPTFSDTALALVSSIASGRLLSAVGFTLTLLLKGYFAGLILAGILTAFASATRVGAIFSRS
jgi:NitT/TauT family transport system permease protein